MPNKVIPGSSKLFDPPPPVYNSTSWATMKDTRFHRCAIFCIADIPPSVIDNLLKESAEYFYQPRATPIDTENDFVLVISKDISTIHYGVTAPVNAFVSPFIGETIDEVAVWFAENIGHEEGLGYSTQLFIILDTEAVEEGICTLVHLTEGEARKLRSDFTVLPCNIANLETGNCGMDEGTMGPFYRTGVAITKDNIKLVQHDGLYLDGMEVKIDEAWRDFSRM